MPIMTEQYEKCRDLFRQIRDFANAGMESNNPIMFGHLLSEIKDVIEDLEEAVGQCL